jgi:hypothetical protein
MGSNRTLRAALGLIVPLLAAGCYDFHLTGPEDAPQVSPPMLVSVTIEYRQPNGCVNSLNTCDEQVIFFASWMPPEGAFPLTRDPNGFIWRGVARNVPVNYPPKDFPHAVRVYDPHILDHPTGGVTAERLRIGGEILTVFDSEGTPKESGLIYVDANGHGRSPL